MSEEFNPFAGGDEVGGNASSKLRTPTFADLSKDVKDKEETDQEYCVRVLKEHNYTESDIGIRDPYWKRKNGIS